MERSSPRWQVDVCAGPQHARGLSVDSGNAVAGARETSYGEIDKLKAGVTLLWPATDARNSSADHCFQRNSARGTNIREQPGRAESYQPGRPGLSCRLEAALYRWRRARRGR